MNVCRKCAEGQHSSCAGRALGPDDQLSVCQCPTPECGRRNFGGID